MKNGQSKTACYLADCSTVYRGRIAQSSKSAARLRLAHNERSDEKLGAMRPSVLQYIVEDILDYLLPNYTNLIARG